MIPLKINGSPAISVLHGQSRPRPLDAQAGREDALSAAPPMLYEDAARLGRVSVPGATV
jgi:hypothetical protein